MPLRQNRIRLLPFENCDSAMKTGRFNIRTGLTVALISLSTAMAAAPAQAAPAPPSFAPLLVADNTTAVPNADGKFTFFSAPKCSGGSCKIVHIMDTDMLRT